MNDTQPKPTGEPMHIISLGAGVQSSTMALMAAHGEITPMPSRAIFADTQDEPKSVYVWLDWLEKQLPFPVHRVTAGKLSDKIASKRKHGEFLRVDIPAFVFLDGKASGLINRSCTRDYKITPIRRKVREILGISGKSIKDVRVIQWIGISLDESHRMKPSLEPWQENRWPLIDARMKRGDCLWWMKKHGFPEPPKSSCTFCPYHSDNQWRSLTKNEFAEAVKIDKRLRSSGAIGATRTIKGVLYLHRSGVPLDQVDFSTDEDHGQQVMFGNECEGMCGV